MKKELYKKQNGKCFFCGTELQIDNMVTDHLYPRSLGGTSTVENIVLSCPKCNIQRGDKMPFREIEFNFFISQLLEKRSDYRNIVQEALISSKMRYRADILVEQKVGSVWKKVLIELKSNPTFTAKRFEDILNQLLTYKSELDKDTKIVLAFPGILPKSDYEAYRKYDIEIWDREVISSKFKDEIKKIDNKLFNKYYSFHSSKSTSENNLLSELKSIPAGKDDWSKYQKHIEKILDYLFGETLSAPIVELPDKYGVNRRDFILRNYSENGYWSYLRDRYKADFIVIDAKNYTGKIKKTKFCK